MFFMSSCLHANIVQRVKRCYKIKINSRESKSCFYGVMLCKQHQCLMIVPLLQYNSGTIRMQKWRYCMIKVALLECKSGAIAALCACLAPLFIAHFFSQPHNYLHISTLSLHAQNSRISHQRFCCAPGS